VHPQQKKKKGIGGRASKGGAESKEKTIGGPKIKTKERRVNDGESCELKEETEG